MRKLYALGALVLLTGFGGGIALRNILLRGAPSIPETASPNTVEDPSAVYRVPVDGSPFRGPHDAPVTIVVFEDFECGSCRRGLALLRDLEQQYPGQLRVVFKHNPLSYHAHALAAAVAAEEARNQGGDELFWKMHDALLEAYDRLDESKIEGTAFSLGMQVQELRTAIRDGRHDGRIEADRRLALQLDGPATPTFYINGRKMPGVYPVDDFRPLIEQAIKDAAALMARGIPAAEVYDTIIRSGATSPVRKPGRSAEGTPARK